MKNAIKNLQNY